MLPTQQSTYRWTNCTISHCLRQSILHSIGEKRPSFLIWAHATSTLLFELINCIQYNNVFFDNCDKNEVPAHRHKHIIYIRNIKTCMFWFLFKWTLNKMRASPILVSRPSGVPRNAAMVTRVCLCAVDAGCHPEEEPCKDVRGDGSHVGPFQTSANADTSWGEKHLNLIELICDIALMQLLPLSI